MGNDPNMLSTLPLGPAPQVDLPPQVQQMLAQAQQGAKQAQAQTQPAAPNPVEQAGQGSFGVPGYNQQGQQTSAMGAKDRLKRALSDAIFAIGSGFQGGPGEAIQASTPQGRDYIHEQRSMAAKQEAAQTALMNARAAQLTQPSGGAGMDEAVFNSLLQQGLSPIDAYRQVKRAPKYPPQETQQGLAAQEGKAVQEMVGQTNPDTGKPFTRLEAIREVKQTMQMAQEGKPIAGNVNGKAAWALWDSKGNQWVSADPSRAPLKEFTPGKNTGLGAYAMVRLLTEAYRYDPRLLTVLPEIFKNMGIEIPAGAIPRGAPPGMPKQPVTGLNIGTAMPQAPPGSIRVRGQMAQDALMRLPDIRQQISDLKGELGPVAGRWNEFITGKIGAPNEKFAALRDNLEYLAGAITRLHLNTEKGLKPFMNMLSAGKMSPANLKAAIDTTEKWAQVYAYTGSGNQPEMAPNAPRHPSAPLGTIQMVSPDGKVWSVPKNRVGVFTKNGYKRKK